MSVEHNKYLHQVIYLATRFGWGCIENSLRMANCIAETRSWIYI